MNLSFNHKYRPKQITDIAYQPVLTTIISNAIIKQKISQAYLFSGMRGIGKTSAARTIANTVNCEKQNISNNIVLSCQQCKNCLAYLKNSHPDIIEIDAASHTGVDNIKTIIEDSIYKPTLGKYKVYIIDEVHMLSKSAFNALLKTLEEPPLGVIFILATTELNKVLKTVISRCQKFELKKVSTSNIEQYLEKICALEKINYTNNALNQIAKSSEGSLRDAMSLLEQAYHMSMACNDESNLISETISSQITGTSHVSLYIDLVKHIVSLNPAECINTLSNLANSNVEEGFILSNLIEIISNLCKAKAISGYYKTLQDNQSYLELLNYIDSYNMPTWTIVWQMLIQETEVLQHAKSHTHLVLEMLCLKLICALQVGQKSFNIKSPVVDEPTRYAEQTEKSSSIIPERLVSILSILHQEKHFELYYYMMNDVEIVNYEKDILILKTKKKSDTIINKILDVVKQCDQKYANLQIQIESTQASPIISTKTKLISNLENSIQWQEMKNYFPEIKVTDILYKD